MQTHSRTLVFNHRNYLLILFRMVLVYLFIVVASLCVCWCVAPAAAIRFLHVFFSIRTTSSLLTHKYVEYIRVAFHLLYSLIYAYGVSISGVVIQ